MCALEIASPEIWLRQFNQKAPRAMPGEENESQSQYGILN